MLCQITQRGVPDALCPQVIEDGRHLLFPVRVGGREKNAHMMRSVEAAELFLPGFLGHVVAQHAVVEILPEHGLER